MSKPHNSQFYLITPPVSEPEKISPALSLALKTYPCAAVLLCLSTATEQKKIQTIKTLAPLIQSENCALLLDKCPNLVEQSGADGCHLEWSEKTSTHIRALKPHFIVGYGPITSKHAAMEAGESGADYLFFEDKTLLVWALELIEIPTIGFARTKSDIPFLQKQGADFIALELEMAMTQTVTSQAEK